jgi:hypothetical protein
MDSIKTLCRSTEKFFDVFLHQADRSSHSFLVMGNDSASFINVASLNLLLSEHVTLSTTLLLTTHQKASEEKARGEKNAMEQI